MTRLGSAKRKRYPSQNVSLKHFSDVNDLYSFIRRRRAWNNFKRGLAEARRASLPPWWTLKHGDIRRIAKERGINPCIISRDYKILRMREYDSVGTMEALIRAIKALRKP